MLGGRMRKLNPMCNYRPNKKSSPITHFCLYLCTQTWMAMAMVVQIGLFYSEQQRHL
ncbi:hypothetical protein RHMOL_Rhmol11G0205300 [Rhododendron molle]|uniref:Uncharacterized protein n=1 Tax=Rhododendron molle TaxID=49168 RepID=A0ACC0LVQ4_RHOML|nr:hypothetical protein RHMOL_Rhmol11G0205300 [Rhododendron molle]